MDVMALLHIWLTAIASFDVCGHLARGIGLDLSCMEVERIEHVW